MVHTELQITKSYTQNYKSLKGTHRIINHTDFV